MNIWYQCEYCGRVYSERKDALECEKKAKKEKPKFRLDSVVEYESKRYKVIGIARPYCSINFVKAIPEIEVDSHNAFVYKLVSLEIVHYPETQEDRFREAEEEDLKLAKIR